MTHNTANIPGLVQPPVGSEVLIALAHPADELLIGGILDRFKNQHITTHAVIATDGESSERGNLKQLGSFDRRNEAGKALGKYGISLGDVHFLGLPDGAVSELIQRKTIARTVGQLLTDHPIQTVVTLGHQGFDNHPDHIAVHYAAEEAALAYAASGQHVELYGLTPHDEGIQIAVDPAIKLRRLSSYKSRFDVDTTDPYHQPVPGTIEQPGIQISKETQDLLGPYYHNIQIERYVSYPLT